MALHLISSLSSFVLCLAKEENNIKWTFRSQSKYKNKTSNEKKTMFWFWEKHWVNTESEKPLQAITLGELRFFVFDLDRLRLLSSEFLGNSIEFHPHCNHLKKYENLCIFEFQDVTEFILIFLFQQFINLKYCSTYFYWKRICFVIILLWH